MYGGFHSMSNSNKAYDPYSNININANFSSAGFKSDRGDKYNIDIDMKKYDEKDNKDSNLGFNNNTNNINKNKSKDTNFNYNYNLNNYNSNLNYTNFKKDEPLTTVNNNNTTEKLKKKKKDFFDDLDNQLKKEKLNEDYDEFGIQLQDRENDHINIKSGEDDSDDLKEITNINKELESFSNSKEINEGSLRNKSKYKANNNLNNYKNKRISEKENNRSQDSSINENLYNLKKKQSDKNSLKLQKNVSEEEDYGNDNYNNDNYENDFDDNLNSYKNSAIDDKSSSKKTLNMQTNEDYRDSTISINAYVENEKKSENKYSNNVNNENDNKKGALNSNKNSNEINITESNDIENNFNSTLKSKSKKEDFDYDRFTLSQQSQSKDFNRQTFNPNADSSKNALHDPSKIEEYLKKSQGMKFYKSDRDENNQITPNKNVNNNNSSNNNLRVSSSHELSKYKNQNDKSSYNYSQELFISQEKKSEKNINKDNVDIESEYNHYEDFDSNLDSIYNESSPYKIASVPNTNRDNNNNLKESKGKSNYSKTINSEFDKSNEDSILKTDSKISGVEKEKNIEAPEKQLIDKIAKNSSNYQSYGNTSAAIKNNLTDVINNKTIEEKSEKSSDILDSKENDKYCQQEILNYNSTGEFNKFKKNNVNAANSNNNTIGNAANSEEVIRNIIAKEMRKYINKNNFNKNQTNNNQANSNNNYQYIINGEDDKANITKARSEILNKIVMIERTNNFLLNDDNSKIKILRKADKFFKLSASHSMEFTLYGNGLSRKDIREMKLDSALTEERKKREFFEFNYNRQKELIEESENKIKKLKSVEVENSELKKLNIELENKYSELEKDLKNIKNEYDYKMKLIEDRVTNRESKNETRKITDIKTRFEIEIDNMRMEIKEKDNDINYLKEKYDILEKENNKLSIHKITAMETNEKIRELQNENFIIHEKLNETQNEKGKIEKEKQKLEKQLELTQLDLMQKHMQIDEVKNQNINMLSSNNKNNENNKNEISTSKHFITHPENFFKSDNSLLYYYNNNNIFEQIYQEREINTHDIFIQSYLKEIQNLQNEIKLLKNINSVNKNTGTGFNFNPINDLSSHNFLDSDNINVLNIENYENEQLTEMEESQMDISQSNSNNIQPNKKKENTPSNIKKNNYLINKTKNAKVLNTKNPPIKTKNPNNAFKNISILKQCAEEKIKKLANLLNQKKTFDSELNNKKINYDGMKILTEEIKLRDKAKTGELDLETYLSILTDTIRIEMNKYELIEIFNNFYKYTPNRIKASDLINALVNNEPSAFFIQSDPGYLIQIEKKIHDYEKHINEKQNAINELNIKINRYHEKFANIEIENKEIKIKCENLEKDKQANQLVFNEIMKNNILRSSGVNFGILTNSVFNFSIYLFYLKYFI